MYNVSIRSKSHIVQSLGTVKTRKLSYCLSFYLKILTRVEIYTGTQTCYL